MKVFVVEDENCVNIGGYDYYETIEEAQQEAIFLYFDCCICCRVVEKEV